MADVNVKYGFHISAKKRGGSFPGADLGIPGLNKASTAKLMGIPA